MSTSNKNLKADKLEMFKFYSISGQIPMYIYNLQIAFQPSNMYMVVACIVHKSLDGGKKDLKISPDKWC